MRGLLLLGLMAAAQAGDPGYELRGRLVPASSASVWLHGATSPFEDSTLADDDGRFRFRDLRAGTYTLGVFLPGQGEMRKTIEIGPSMADSRKRVELMVKLSDGLLESHDSLRRSNLVSTRELAIPEEAHREYEDAEKRLARRDADGALAHLNRAVALAPKFTQAWNYLGTIAYQRQDYERAEHCFRQALEADSSAFEPLVNLGGVLINLHKLEEALQYNRHAVLARPQDALANSQLGMTYFYLDRLDLSQQYLAVAKQVDPSHFSHPQLLLAEIYLRRHDNAAAAGELEELLKLHPDAPEAPRIRMRLAQLRTAPEGSADPAEAYQASGMARSFSTVPDLPPDGSGAYRVVRREARLFLEGPDAGGHDQQSSIDAVIGSGRLARALMHKNAGGNWTELPLGWYAKGGWRSGPAAPHQQNCLACHAAETGDHFEAIGCARCHKSGASKPAQEVCLGCHTAGGATNDDKIELNSAGYRLSESHCHQTAGRQIGCMACHPAHTFSNTPEGFRQVCRGCHPSTHNGAALDCVRCHMPKRPAEDAAGIMVTDHRIQRPL